MQTPSAFFRRDDGERDPPSLVLSLEGCPLASDRASGLADKRERATETCKDVPSLNRPLLRDHRDGAGVVAVVKSWEQRLPSSPPANGFRG